MPATCPCGRDARQTGPRMEGVAPGPAAPSWGSPSRSSFQLRLRPLRVQLRNGTLVALARAVRSPSGPRGDPGAACARGHALRRAPYRWPGQDTQGSHHLGIWLVLSAGPEPGSAGVWRLQQVGPPVARCPGTRAWPAWSVMEPGASPLDLPGQTNHPAWSLEFPPSLRVLLEQQGLGWRRTADSGTFRGWDPGTKIFSKSRETFAQGWSFPSGPKALMAVVRPGSGPLWVFGSLKGPEPPE